MIYAHFFVAKMIWAHLFCCKDDLHTLFFVAKTINAPFLSQKEFTHVFLSQKRFTRFFLSRKRFTHSARKVFARWKLPSGKFRLFGPLHSPPENNHPAHLRSATITQPSSPQRPPLPWLSLKKILTVVNFTFLVVVNINFLVVVDINFYVVVNTRILLLWNCLFEGGLYLWSWPRW